MDIKFYFLIFYILVIYTTVHCSNISSSQSLYHITDYILSFDTYHFEWNKHHFTTQKTTADDLHHACTPHIPSLCIRYTPNKIGFILQFNDSSYDFMNHDDWTSFNWIHTPSSIASYQDILHISSNDPLPLMEEEEDDALEPFQSPNPHHSGRRLLRSRARCRVYLYRNSKFSGRKGGTFRRRRYSRTALRRRGFRSGGVKSIRVRGSRCCTAKLYRNDGYRGKRVRFKRGSYSRIRRRKHRIESLGSMKVYCSRSRRGRARRGGRRIGRGLRRFGKFVGRAGSTIMKHLSGAMGPRPIPILLGPMTGMLGHFGYSMHPVMPPQLAMQHSMMGNYGHGGGMPMMSHPMYGHPSYGSGYGMPMGSMGGMGGMMGGMGGMGGMMGGGMGAMGGMMGGMHPMSGMGMGSMGGMMGGMGGYGGGMMGGMHPMMSGMHGYGGMHPMMGGSPMMDQQLPEAQGKTPVVHVYTDDDTGETGAESNEVMNEQRRRMMEDVYDGVGLRKCAVMNGGEICGTFYAGRGGITVDYTVKRGKVLRIDEDEEDEDEEDDLSESEVVIEYVEDEDDSGYDEDVEDDDEDEFSEFEIQHEDYALMRNERIFEIEVDEEITEHYKDALVDVTQTVLWIWTKHECNEYMMAFMNMSICTMNVMDDNKDDDILIYSKYDVEEDAMEIDEFEMNVRNQMDWDEIYYINMFRENKTNNRKLCKAISIMKVCVEMNDDQYVNGNIKEMLISIESL